MLVDIFKGYGWQYIGEESGAWIDIIKKEKSRVYKVLMRRLSMNYLHDDLLCFYWLNGSYIFHRMQIISSYAQVAPMEAIDHIKHQIVI
jgi:hypothetical protein